MDSAAVGTFSLNAVAVHIHATGDLHRISPFVYGAAFAPNSEYLRQAGITVNRWGGNRSSKYNWTLGVASSAGDWFYENWDWDGESAESSAQGFALRNAAGGAATLLTLPTLSWVAKDNFSHSFSVAKYGAQDDASEQLARLSGLQAVRKLRRSE